MNRYASLYLASNTRARLWCALSLFIATLLLLSVSSSTAAAQLLQNRFAKRIRAALPNKIQPVVTDNFEVYANDEVLAQKVAREAERYRKELAIEWIGEALPDWPQRCPIEVQIGPDAGGETSFAFVFDQAGRGQPIDWKMKIFGPPNRLLDAVLPHEVTHTIFATHFGRPLPRWADEGACTTVEHIAERTKNHAMLIRFLSARPSRGIPFNRMFTMKEYPHDILPLYAQGYSLAKFLIFQKERRHFVDYIAQGMQYESQMPALEAWDLATQEYYQFEDLSELQLAWQAWVKQGSKKDEIAKFSKINLDRVAKASSSNARPLPASRPLPEGRSIANARPAPTQRGFVERFAAIPRSGQSAPGGTFARFELAKGSRDASRTGRVVESAPHRGWTGKPIDTTITPKTFAVNDSQIKATNSQATPTSWYSSQMRPGRTAQAVSFQESQRAIKTRRISTHVRTPEPHRNAGDMHLENAGLDLNREVSTDDPTKPRGENNQTNNRVRSMIRIPELEEMKRHQVAPRPIEPRTILR